MLKMRSGMAHDGEEGDSLEAALSSGRESQSYSWQVSFFDIHSVASAISSKVPFPSELKFLCAFR